MAICKSDVVASIPPVSARPNPVGFLSDAISNLQIMLEQLESNMSDHMDKSQMMEDPVKTPSEPFPEGSYLYNFIMQSAKRVNELTKQVQSLALSIDI